VDTFDEWEFGNNDAPEPTEQQDDAFGDEFDFNSEPKESTTEGFDFDEQPPSTEVEPDTAFDFESEPVK